MSDLGWRADGMARARAAGGIDLDLYRRPGFTGGMAVRRAGEAGGQGFETWESDDDASGEIDPTPVMFARGGRHGARR